MTHYFGTLPTLSYRKEPPTSNGETLSVSPTPEQPMNFKKGLLLLLMGAGMIGRSLGFEIDTNSIPRGFVLNQDELDKSKTLLLINTLSPSGEYVFAVKGKYDHHELHILSAKTFKDLAPPIQTDCIFIQSLPRLSTTALWNQKEDRVALETGGRTWSNVYLLSFVKGRLNLFKLDEEQYKNLIKENIPTTAKITRLYINCTPFNSSKWINKNSVTVQYDGSVQLQNGDFKEFSIPLIWEIDSNSTIRVVAPKPKTSPTPQ
jgi:hypothetical protein